MSSDLSLWDRLTGGAAGPFQSSLRCWTGDKYQTWRWSEVVKAAQATTSGLRAVGVRPGTRVAAVLTNNPYAVQGLLGIWLAGGTVASLPVPARGMIFEEFAEQLTTIGDRLEPTVFVVDDELLSLLPDMLRSRFHFRSWESFADTGTIAAEPPGEDETAFIQFSSGSTSAPKGCMLTPRAIAAQLDIISELIDAGRRDVFVSWLPLSHDMGLFGGLLAPWVNDMSLYLSTPQRFTITPMSWFTDMAELGGRSSAGTNSSLYLAARAAKRSSRMPAAGLGSVEHCIVGAERIEWETLKFAAAALAPHGLRPNGIVPAYGLAEATLAVTGTPKGHQPWSRTVLNTAALADGELVEVGDDHSNAVSVVSAGIPCPGVELVMTDGGGLEEIVVQTPSAASGYWDDTQRTRETFQGCLIRTGDLGFVKDGHLYPVGRTDDMLSIAGRKVYAREIERLVDDIDGVRRGCSTLVAHHDGSTQRLTLFIEVSNHAAQYQVVADSAAQAAMAKAAITLDDCVFLCRDALPKTPTGKIQRHRCQTMFESGRFDPLAVIELGV